MLSCWSSEGVFYLISSWAVSKDQMLYTCFHFAFVSSEITDEANVLVFPSINEVGAAW